MNELKVFEHKEFGQVRTVLHDGEPWFVAADVCKALVISNNRDAIGRLEDDEKGVVSTDTLGGKQNVTVINEPGLYSLVLGSRKPEAKAFKRWITHEVIPAIRRHGMYATDDVVDRMLNDPDTMIRALQALKEEREKTALLESKMAQDAPKVLFADSVAASSQSILVGVMAKMLRQNGVNVGQNRLFTILRDDGLLHKEGAQKNLPTQYAVEHGWFEIKERSVNNPDGTVRITQTPLVTGKGQVYLMNRYKAV